ncbi:hypothetical protein OIU77_025742 [Salix suchowensis]|uniref:Uncharacterized protein n=1 Tax=Salix suchowensis TaxID=1278906 RepID=A0ABQ9BY32_9ROSI|nr:hypothetical protein OIU77_025742 [Salix suchowensis]
MQCFVTPDCGMAVQKCWISILYLCVGDGWQNIEWWWYLFVADLIVIVLLLEYFPSCLKFTTWSADHNDAGPRGHSEVLLSF